MYLKLGVKMKIYKGALVFCILFAFTACGLFSKSIIQGDVLGNTSGLERDEESWNALIYVRPGYNIGEYRKFKIDPVLTKSIGKYMSGLSANDKKTLAGYLRKAVRKELTDGGYQVVNQVGPDIVGIRFTLTDANSGSPYLNVLQFTTYGFGMDIGGLTIESEFYDTSNNQVNEIAVVGAEGVRKFNAPSIMEEWASVKRVFDDWAKGFRNRLDEAHVSPNEDY